MDEKKTQSKITYWFTGSLIQITPEWSYAFLLRVATIRDNLDGYPGDTQVDVVDKCFLYNDEETLQNTFKKWCVFCDYLQDKYSRRKEKEDG